MKRSTVETRIAPRSRAELAAAVAGLSGTLALSLAGCAPATDTDRPTVIASPYIAPSPSATPEAVLGIEEQYDAAADYLLTLRTSSDLASPISIPASIQDPTVLQETLHAAELKSAASIVLDYTDSVVDGDPTRRLDVIEGTDVRQLAEDAVVQGQYTIELFDLIDGEKSDDFSGVEQEMNSLLSDNEAKLAEITALLDKYEAMSEKSRQDLDAGNTKDWYEAKNELTSAWYEAKNAVVSAWSDLNTAAITAEVDILNKSPKHQEMMEQAEADYQEYLKKCDDLLALEKDRCAADEAVSAAQGWHANLFDIWAPLVHDSEQRLRIERAAADQAIKAAEDWHGNLFDIWAGYIEDNNQRLRVEAAAADQAIKAIEDNHTSLATVWAERVSNPADIRRLDQAYSEAAIAAYDKGYDALGNAWADEIQDPALRTSTQTHSK